MLGQGGGRTGAQPGPVHVVSGGRNHVRHEPLVAGTVLAHEDGGAGDVRVAEHHGLDLAEFDAEATHLDLEVGAAEVVELSVGHPAHQVAGAVHPGSGGPVRVGDEALGREAGAAVGSRGPDRGPRCTSSPGTPTGTGCSAASRTYRRVLRIGAPIGGAPAICSRVYQAAA